MHPDDALRDELIRLNDASGGALDWHALRGIARTRRIGSGVAQGLRGTQVGRVLLRRVERAIQRDSKRRAVVFLAHGFHPRDAQLVGLLRRSLKSKKLRIVTGEKPAPRSVSAKVLDRIDSSWVFVALFTPDPSTGQPSPWIVSELGYAARKPRVVLLQRPLEQRQIGGIQGDVEYIAFARAAPKAAFARAADSAAEGSARFSKI